MKQNRTCAVSTSSRQIDPEIQSSTEAAIHAIHDPTGLCLFPRESCNAAGNPISAVGVSPGPTSRTVVTCAPSDGKAELAVKCVGIAGDWPCLSSCLKLSVVEETLQDVVPMDADILGCHRSAIKAMCASCVARGQGPRSRTTGCLMTPSLV
jgi:hypothetical protein